MKFQDADLFVERVPEAAARQLALVLAELAERHLESMEWVQAHKGRFPAYEKRRMAEWTDVLLRHLYDLKVPARGLWYRECERLQREYDKRSAPPERNSAP